MDMSHLQLLNQTTQIFEALERGAAHGGELWQTNHIGRLVFEITALEVDQQQMSLMIETNPNVIFVGDYPIFLRLRYRNLIFRLNPGQYGVLDGKLVCECPPEARALAPRNGDRFALSSCHGISLSLRRIERSVMEAPREIELRILDFSEKGFGILISSANRNFLRCKDHFWITAIDQRPLRSEILGSVSYVAPRFRCQKRGDVRVGLNLDRALAQDIYENLKKRSHLTLSA
jgi:hypothetical protein